MAVDNTAARSLHDVGPAAWFGGSLMGAVGLNRVAGAAKEPRRCWWSTPAWASSNALPRSPAGCSAACGQDEPTNQDRRYRNGFGGSLGTPSDPISRSMYEPGPKVDCCSGVGTQGPVE
jgi:hypothetical protein